MCDGVTFQAEAGKKGGSASSGRRRPDRRVPHRGRGEAPQGLPRRCGWRRLEQPRGLQLGLRHGQHDLPPPHRQAHEDAHRAHHRGRRRRLRRRQVLPGVLRHAGHVERARAVHFSRPAPHGRRPEHLHDRRHGHGPGTPRRPWAPAASGDSIGPRAPQPGPHGAFRQVRHDGLHVRPTCPATRPTRGGKKGHLNACLNKGDKVLLPYMPVGPDSTKAALESATAFTADTGNMYTVVKVGTAAPSASTPTTEDRYYFVVDKAINWDGSATHARKDFGIGGGPTGWTLGPISQGQFDGMASPGDQKMGTVPVVKFEPGPTSYEFVARCRAAASATATTAPAKSWATRATTATSSPRLPSRKGARPLPRPSDAPPLPGHDAKRTHPPDSCFVSLPGAFHLAGKTPPPLREKSVALPGGPAGAETRRRGEVPEGERARSGASARTSISRLPRVEAAERGELLRLRHALSATGPVSRIASWKQPRARVHSRRRRGRAPSFR